MACYWNGLQVYVCLTTISIVNALLCLLLLLMLYFANALVGLQSRAIQQSF